MTFFHKLIGFFNSWFKMWFVSFLYLFRRALARTLGTFWHLWCRDFQPVTIETRINHTRTTFKGWGGLRECLCRSICLYVCVWLGVDIHVRMRVMHASTASLHWCQQINTKPRLYRWRNKVCRCIHVRMRVMHASTASLHWCQQINTKPRLYRWRNKVCRCIHASTDVHVNV